MKGEGEGRTNVKLLHTRLVQMHPQTRRRLQESVLNAVYDAISPADDVHGPSRQYRLCR